MVAGLGVLVFRAFFRKQSPTLYEHVDIVGKGLDKDVSRLSHLTVHLNKNIDRTGCDLRILVGNLHSYTANQPYTDPAKQAYYGDAAMMIAKYKTHVLC